MTMEFKYLGEKVFVDENDNVICENKFIKEAFEFALKIAIPQSESYKGFLSGLDDNKAIEFVAFHFESKKEEEEISKRIY